MVGYADEEAVVIDKKSLLALAQRWEIVEEDLAGGGRIQVDVKWIEATSKGRLMRECAKELCEMIKPEEEPAPRHAFEVNLSIGSCEWDHVLECVDEMRRELESHGPECGLTSGGWRGCMSIDIQRREVTPDDYRKELSEWFDRTRDAKRPSA